MSKLPSRFVEFQKSYPEIFSAYESLGKAVSGAGPLDKKQAALIKLGIACGARLEGAVHAHCRRALDAGATKEEIRHTILQATTTIGFPSMMACLSWADDVLSKKE
ncbi:MAG TPA: carboxymuconolactone decarboxylase family protein [Candidatus Obscuribacterales bacterium]